MTDQIVDEMAQRRAFIARWRQETGIGVKTVPDPITMAPQPNPPMPEQAAQSADLRLSERALHAIQRGHMDTGNAL